MIENVLKGQHNFAYCISHFAFISIIIPSNHPICKHFLAVHKLGDNSLQFIHPMGHFCGIMEKMTTNAKMEVFLWLYLF